MITKQQAPVILLAFANEYEKHKHYLENLRWEREALRGILKDAEKKGLCEVEIIYDATLDKIVAAFHDDQLKNRIAIFHYAGHGDEYSLHLDAVHRTQNKAYANGFASFLGAQGSLKLVFLNACTTKQQANVLHQSNIPVVISTHAKIRDTLAKEVASWFYKALATGSSIQQSFQEALALIQTSTSDRIDYRGTGERIKNTTTLFDWDCSVHPAFPKAANWNLIDATDNPLLSLPTLPSSNFPNEPFPGLSSYPQRLATVFGGRDQEIFQLYEMLTTANNSSLILFYAAIGVGKTSLLEAGLIPHLNQVHFLDINSLDKIAITEILDGIIKEASEKETTRIIIIDALITVDLKLLQFVKPILEQQRIRIQFLFSISTCNLDAWENKLTRSAINYTSFYLQPLRARQLKKWMIQLNQNNNLTIDPNLAEPLAALLTKDELSPVAPFLQWSMVQLWISAKTLKNNHPYLGWPLFQELTNNNLWSRFLIQQLEKIDILATKNGLLLNILDDCIHVNTSTSIAQLQQNYSHLHNLTINDYLHSFKKHYILAHPAIDRHSATNKLNLAHTILREPLLILLNQSNRPGQLVRRLLNQPRTYDFDPSEIELIEKNLQTLPILSSDAQSLLIKSKDNLKKEKQRKKGVLIVQVLLILMILSIGFLFENSYFLLYVILLMVLYKR